MKIDLYTKAVLTVIAIGIGCLAFDTKPIKEAHAITKKELERRIGWNVKSIVDVNTTHNANYKKLLSEIGKLQLRVGALERKQK